jgi:hypothetical protein
MAKKDMPDDVKQIVTEAQEEFDLEARLTNRKMRTGQITVFTDEVLAEAHSDAERAVALLERARDIAGEDDDTENDALPALKEAAAAALEELNKTAITFHFQAVPPIIQKAGRRKARKDMGLKSEVPADKVEEFSDLITAYLLSDCTVRYVDHQSGTTVNDLTVKAARALINFLPDAEFKRLDLKLGEVQFKNVISESATAQIDF